MSALLATLLSGAMLYLSQGVANVWPLAWFAPVPLLWLAYGRARTWQVILAALGSILAGAIYIWQCYSTAPPLILLQVIVPQAVLFPIAVLFARLTQRRSPALITLFTFPACWTAFEYFICVLSPNGSFGSFGYSQVSAPVLIQSASLFGVFVVTFLICLFSNSIAMLVRAPKSAAIAAGLGFTITALNVGFGAIRLAEPQPAAIRAAAFVDDGAMIRAWRAHSANDLITAATDYADTIRRAAGQGARIVVAPEGGLVSTGRLLPAVLAPIVAVSKQTGAQLIIGVNETTPPGDLAFSVEPDGAVQRGTLPPARQWSSPMCRSARARRSIRS